MLASSLLLQAGPPANKNEARFIHTTLLYIGVYGHDLYVYMYVCIFIKLHITAQSGPVIYSFYATACNPPGGYLS